MSAVPGIICMTHQDNRFQTEIRIVDLETPPALATVEQRGLVMAVNYAGLLAKSQSNC